jgi:hypothetical protein
VSPQAVRDALRRIAAAGADEVILVPTGHDLDQLDRLRDAIG